MLQIHFEIDLNKALEKKMDSTFVETYLEKIINRSGLQWLEKSTPIYACMIDGTEKEEALAYMSLMSELCYSYFLRNTVKSCLVYNLEEETGELIEEDETEYILDIYKNIA